MNEFSYKERLWFGVLGLITLLTVAYFSIKENADFKEVYTAPVEYGGLLCEKLVEEDFLSYLESLRLEFYTNEIADLEILYIAVSNNGVSAFVSCDSDVFHVQAYDVAGEFLWGISGHNRGLAGISFDEDVLNIYLVREMLLVSCDQDGNIIDILRICPSVDENHKTYETNYSRTDIKSENLHYFLRGKKRTGFQQFVCGSDSDNGFLIYGDNS